MAYEDEENLTVVINENTGSDPGSGIKQEYSENDLWGNIKLFYEQEIRN